MVTSSTAPREWALGALVVVLATAVAVAGAHHSAGSYNDGSRLATVECLVDYHTLAIDESVYVKPRSEPPLAYRADLPFLNEHGTLDKLFIKGHYYSDKPPFPAVLMAGVYKSLQELTGLHARARPDWFYHAMTVSSCGLAYVVAVWCVFRLGRVLGLSAGLRLGLTASFALATTALPYVRDSNGHLMQLGAAAAVLLGLVSWAAGGQKWRPGLLLGIGFLAGLAYSIEQAAGGLLAAGAVLLVAYREWSVSPRRGWWRGVPWAAVLVGLGTLPCALAHHALVYSFAGSLRPANVFPEYFNYPGSVFTARDLTGVYNHPTILHFLAYAGGLLLGERGFLQYDLALFLFVPAALMLLRRPTPRVECGARSGERGEGGVAGERGTPLRAPLSTLHTPRDFIPEVVFACGWCVSTWLVYALLSTNFSGACCSVRWFVPLLAPGYFVLALAVRDSRAYRQDFLVLSLWGGVLGALMAVEGAWGSEVPCFWPLQGAALATWLATGRLVPAWLDRLAGFLVRQGWLLLGLCTVGPLLAERGAIDFLVTERIEILRAGWACLCLALGFVVGVRARVDAREGPGAGWVTLALAALALGLTAIHYALVDCQPPRLAWQRALYLDVLNHRALAPHGYRPLPYGFVRLLEWITHDWLLACLTYRWLFTFWLAWAWYRFARLFHPPARAVLTLVPLVLLYPLSVLFYLGQLTDPLSHALLVLGLVYVVRDRPGPLALALAFGVPTKETAVLLVPVYLACRWRQGRRALAQTALLGGTCVAAFLAVRLPLGWRPGFEAVNGLDGLMVGTNLGFGPRQAVTNVPLYQNYLQPLLFVGSFVPFIVARWKRIDPRLRAVGLTLTPLLLASNLCFGWLYESRNYVPLLPVLAAMALPSAVPGAPTPQPPRRERQAIGT